MGRGGEPELLATFKSSISSCIVMVGRMTPRDRIVVRNSTLLNIFFVKQIFRLSSTGTTCPPSCKQWWTAVWRSLSRPLRGRTLLLQVNLKTAVNGGLKVITTINNRGLQVTASKINPI